MRFKWEINKITSTYSNKLWEVMFIWKSRTLKVMCNWRKSLRLWSSLSYCWVKVIKCSLWQQPVFQEHKHYVFFTWRWTNLSKTGTIWSIFGSFCRKISRFVQTLRLLKRSLKVKAIFRRLKSTNNLKSRNWSSIWENSNSSKMNRGLATRG